MKSNFFKFFVKYEFLSLGERDVPAYHNPGHISQLMGVARKGNIAQGHIGQGHIGQGHIGQGSHILLLLLAGPPPLETSGIV